MSESGRRLKTVCVSSDSLACNTENACMIQAFSVLHASESLLIQAVSVMLGVEMRGWQTRKYKIIICRVQ